VVVYGLLPMGLHLPGEVSTAVRGDTPDPAPDGMISATLEQSLELMGKLPAEGARTMRAIYWEHGGPHGVLGAAQSSPVAIGDAAGGFAREYESTKRIATCHNPNRGVMTRLRSVIVWSPATGAHVVSGDILEAWRKSGGAKGPLGYPIADETNAPDSHGRVSRFQHGEIVWRQAAGTTIRMEGQ
jgi:hypothetical protein